MDAAQIAGPGDVPHRDGFAVTGCGSYSVCVSAAVAIAEFVSGLGDAGPEFGEIDHGYVLV